MADLIVPTTHRSLRGVYFALCFALALSGEEVLLRGSASGRTLANLSLDIRQHSETVAAGAHSTCAQQDCSGSANKNATCQCTFDCTEYEDCCSDFWSVCALPPTSCAFEGCGGAWKPQNSCQCTDDCEQYGSCCADYWDTCAKTSYETYFDKNAFTPFGAVDIDNDATAPIGLTSDECQHRCTSDERCSCVAWFRATGQCWKRGTCQPSGWTSAYNVGFNVYLKNTEESECDRSPEWTPCADEACARQMFQRRRRHESMGSCRRRAGFSTTGTARCCGKTMYRKVFQAPSTGIFSGLSLQAPNGNMSNISTAVVYP